jgi:hypothetical protein
VYETVVAETVAAGDFDEDGDVGESLHPDSETVAIIASISAARRNCVSIAKTVIGSRSTPRPALEFAVIARP